MATTVERPRWRVYEVRETDMYGYYKTKYGVREEYTDGATRYTHSERFEAREDAERLAALFEVNARKGKTYDNVMKAWS